MTPTTSSTNASGTRYQVSIGYYGRKMIWRGPCEGLLDWPAWKWVTLTPRPLGLKSAKALADKQAQYSVVNVWMTAQKVYDNGLPPAVPDGWVAAEE